MLEKERFDLNCHTLLNFANCLLSPLLAISRVSLGSITQTAFCVYSRKYGLFTILNVGIMAANISKSSMSA